MCYNKGLVYFKYFIVYCVLYVYGYICIGKDIDIYFGFF